MKKLLLTFLILNSSLLTLQAQTYTINSVAGNGIATYSGDSVLATTAALNLPSGIAVDTLGRFYIADATNHRVREVDTNGEIYTIAGFSAAGYSGDGGPARSAELKNPYGVAVDKLGNIFIADQGNNRIRKVNAAGIITTIAGNGTAGYSGDGSPATAAEINKPFQVATDTVGNIYFADQNNFRVRKVDAVTGIISTVAGNGTSGYSGDGGQATNAELGMPQGVAVDAQGNLYITDPGNYYIRKVTASTGKISTIAGTGTFGFAGDGNPATTATIGYVCEIAVGGGNVFFSDASANRIRIINASGMMNTIAGTGASGWSGDGGVATLAEMYAPYGVAYRPKNGYLYINDQLDNHTRLLQPVTESVNNLKASAVKANVYPNPNHGSFQLKITNYEVGINNRVEIYNMLGEKVYATPLNIEHSTFSINQPAGIYFYRIVSGNGAEVATGRFIIE